MSKWSRCVGDNLGEDMYVVDIVFWQESYIININSATAVGPIETMVPRLPGRTIIDCNSAAAVGPIGLGCRWVVGRMSTNLKSDCGPHRIGDGSEE